INSNNINGNNYRLCKLDNSSIKPICKINDDDFKLNLDYWNLLYPKAVGYSAGVIDYFLKQFEQIDKSKKEQEQISTWNKLKNYFAWLKSEAQYIWGDVFMAQRNALVRSYDSLVAFITNTRDDVQNFSDANREIVEQTVNQAGQVLSAFEQAGTAEEIFNFQPTRAENEPENNGIPLTLETPLGDYFIKDSEEIPLSSDTGGGGENPLATPEQPAEEGEEPLVEKTPLTPVSPAGYGNTAPTFIFVAGDSTPPETTITSAPGEIINLNSADFIFASSESNSTFDCNLNDAGWEICASPYNLINLSDRDYIFKVRARDAANNIDQTPAEYSLTVDTTAPEITVLSGPPAIASSTTANFEFNSSEDETSYQCRLDANSWETCSASTSAFNLIEGDHSLEVKGSDPAGNIGSSTLITWLLDLTAPTSTMVSLEAVYETVGFTVAWSGEDVDATGSSTPVSGLADFTVQYKIDAGDWKNWLNATTSTSTIFNLSVASGQTVYFRVKAGDNAGNLGEWSAQAQTKINSSPGAILNLTAIMASTTVSSITLSWSSPENGRLNDTAYYEIKYQEKNGDCSLQLNWDSAIAVASSSLPAPGEIFGAAESARVTGLSSNKEYCLAVRTFNGLYWSDLSNQVNAVTSQNKITAGDTSTAYGNWQSAFSWKHTVSGDDPILVVSVHGDGGYLNANSVTYNGQPLTLAVSKVRDQSYNNLAVSIYYLANPPKGEYTIEVSIGWPFPFSASAITFNNCDTADPVNLAGASLESLASTVNSLEITKPKAMIIDAVTYNQPESFSLAPGQGQTQYFTNYQWGQANDLHSSGSYKLAEQAGTQTMAWNTLDDRTSVHAFIVLNPKP
ncbi:MAG: fibronectin type III domain-containing protein, partial [bacterium]